MEVYEGLVS